MHVLAVFCHPDRDSFSGAVLDRFVDGVEEAGHSCEVADLYREAFDPVMSMRDLQQFEEMARAAGFRLTMQWSDERDWFSVCFLEVEDA